ncbi:MAG: NhaA family Na+:H+ antiporter [Planctomycetota bacterium]|jgi:NhaA family Na+:H+ antiporter
MRTKIKFLLDNSMFLIIGTIAALAWANINFDSYDHFLHTPLIEDTIVGQVMHHDDHGTEEAAKGAGTELSESAKALAAGEKPIEQAKGDDHGAKKKKTITLHYLVNDILMALFFAIAGKEVWEATFPGGPLSNAKKAATPLFATVGGMVGPAAVYCLIAYMGGSFGELSNGWAIPCATDIAFSYMVARIVFGAGHPAIPFLLLLAIADDALGLVILAVFYPNPDIPVEPIWLLLPVASMVICTVFKRMKVVSFWPYLLVAGTVSWFGFALAGLHPALGLLPIIPFMPHAHVDTGLFDWSKLEKNDTLSHFEHWMKNPVELILGAFGLLNAGVLLSSSGTATWAILGGLIIGKPLGIFIFGMIAAKGLGFGFPKGMNWKDLIVLGCAAAIGFTVALFIATVAFQVGPIQSAAKMGALGSFAAAIITIIAGKMMGIKKVAGAPAAGGHGH